MHTSEQLELQLLRNPYALVTRSTCCRSCVTTRSCVWFHPLLHRADEVVINWKTLRDHMPQAIAAFFLVGDDLGQGDKTGIDVVKAHSNFLSKHQLTALEVPLAKFDPWDWDTPFSSWATHLH